MPVAPVRFNRVSFPTIAIALMAIFVGTLTVRAADAPLRSGIDRANFDTSIRPGDDFYQYVNGNWIKNNPIPPEYSRWGAFPKLRDDNLEALHQIVEELAHTTAPLDEDSRKVRDLYLTAMDETKLREQGATPLAGELNWIASLKNRDELVKLIGHLHAAGIPALFTFNIAQDEKQSSQYIAHLRQGGLGLPERGYYVGTGDDSTKVRTQYREHIAKMLTLLGRSAAQAATDADTVLAIETKLAEASRTPVQLRDREAQYNKKSAADLASLTPHLKWDDYLHAIEVPGVSQAIVGQPEFFARVDQQLADVPLEQWQVYVRWHLIHATASYLGGDFEQESFRFYSEVLRGVKQMQPRWKRALTSVDLLMGEALGRLYVQKHFPPAARQRMDDLVKNILAVYRERIESRQWMSQQTREQALAKLAMVMPKIGYPNQWRDYSGLEIRPDSYVQNVMRAMAFDTRYRLSKLGKPVDRGEWRMTTPTVNAYYNSTLNEIVFPAGILQPPFFDSQADDAVNYGAIGAVIGHEITHGFDDQGSRSDGEGNLKNWWTPDDRAKFTALADRLVKQYDDCVAVADQHVNGRLTLGENLADLGGINIAYAAYQKSLHGKPAPVIDGFTGPQRFYIGFAQIWRGSIRDADQLLLLRTDPHSPAQFRVLVPLSNVQAFYDAFDIKPTDKMYRPPETRVEVW
jgi:putative endopeptidase